MDRRFAVVARARIDLSSGPFMLGDNATNLKHQVSEADHNYSLFMDLFHDVLLLSVLPMHTRS